MCIFHCICVFSFVFLVYLILFLTKKQGLYINHVYVYTSRTNNFSIILRNSSLETSNLHVGPNTKINWLLHYNNLPCHREFSIHIFGTVTIFFSLFNCPTWVLMTYSPPEMETSERTSFWDIGKLYTVISKQLKAK